MRPYKLYKKQQEVTDNNVLLWITRYLYSNDINVRPRSVQERLFPAKVVETPAIELTANGPVICGLSDIIEYYSRELQIDNLQTKSEDFKKNNPKYKITP
jgi:hypothetical protein